ANAIARAVAESSPPLKSTTALFLEVICSRSCRSLARRGRWVQQCIAARVTSRVSVKCKRGMSGVFWMFGELGNQKLADACLPDESMCVIVYCAPGQTQ